MLLTTINIGRSPAYGIIICRFLVVYMSQISKGVFALILKRIRRDRKVPQKELAALCGVSVRNWGRWESPTDPAWPPSELLPAIAKRLNCSIDALYDNTPDWLPQSHYEREILTAVRRSSVSETQRALVMLTALEDMSKEDRELWTRLGDRLRKGKR